MSLFARLKRVFSRKTVVVDARELEALKRENAENGTYAEAGDELDPIYSVQKLENRGTRGSVAGAQYDQEMFRVEEAARAAQIINAQNERDRDS